MNSNNKLRYFFVPYQCFDKFSGVLVGQGVVEHVNENFPSREKLAADIKKLYPIEINVIFGVPTEITAEDFKMWRA